eukprot:738533-Pyramimonas_sp.AAC.1
MVGYMLRVWRMSHDLTAWRVCELAGVAHFAVLPGRRGTFGGCCIDYRSGLIQQSGHTVQPAQGEQPVNARILCLHHHPRDFSG